MAWRGCGAQLQGAMQEAGMGGTGVFSDCEAGHTHPCTCSLCSTLWPCAIPPPQGCAPCHTAGGYSLHHGCFPCHAPWPISSHASPRALHHTLGTLPVPHGHSWWAFPTLWPLHMPHPAAMCHPLSTPTWHAPHAPCYSPCMLHPLLLTAPRPVHHTMPLHTTPWGCSPHHADPACR